MSTSVEKLIESQDLKETVAGLNFEQGLAMMEELVAKVESGVLPLTTAMSAYEAGVVLTEHLRGLLSGAETKLKVLQKPA